PRSALLPPDRGRSPARQPRQGAPRAGLAAQGHLPPADPDDGPRRRGGRPLVAGRATADVLKEQPRATASNRPGRQESDMKTVVFGASGTLGQALTAVLPGAGYEVVAGLDRKGC